MKLQGKVAIVTGASSGMGREIALAFAKEGAKVLAVARRAERLAELVEMSKSLSGEIAAYSVDLSDMGNVEDMIDEAVKVFGKLDILVNNAGIMDDMSAVGDASDKIFDSVFNVNVRAPFAAMRKAVKYFETAGGGVIINTASIAGIKGGAAGVAYTASKHALVGMTRNTGFMYAQKNIRCNAICPGAVMTEIGNTENMRNANKEGAARCGLGMGLNPRFGEAKEIAATAVFLASDDSSFINGQTIVADGGWSSY